MHNATHKTQRFSIYKMLPIYHITKYSTIIEGTGSTISNPHETFFGMRAITLKKISLQSHCKCAYKKRVHFHCIWITGVGTLPTRSLNAPRPPNLLRNHIRYMNNNSAKFHRNRVADVRTTTMQSSIVMEWPV